MANKEFIIEEEVAYLEREGKQFEKDPFNVFITPYNEAEIIQSIQNFIIDLKVDHKISKEKFSELMTIVSSAIFESITVDEMVEKITKVYSKSDIWDVLVESGYLPF